MSIAAALLIAPTGQPATGQPNATAERGDAFAALLDVATPAEAGGATVAVAPAPQPFPTQSPLLHLQLGVEGDIATPAPPIGSDALVASTAVEADAANSAVGKSAAGAPASISTSAPDSVVAAVPSAPANAAADHDAAATPATVTTETAIDATAPTISPTPTSATNATAAATPALTVQAAQPADISETSSENESETNSEDGETAITPSSAQTTAPVATAVSPIAVVAPPATQPATEPVAAIPAATEAPLEPMVQADSATAETREPVTASGEAVSTSTSNRAAAHPTAPAQVFAAAPANDAVMAKHDAASLTAAPTAQPVDGSTTTAQPAEAARASTTPQALQSAPAATVQVYSRIIERADGRSQRFEIRLDPAELGRVDVRIEIGADRKVHAVLAAHDSAALSDLMRGQRALERALTDAGIDLADKGVRFELASDTGSGTASQQRDGEGGNRGAQANVWRRFESMNMPVTDETAAAVSQPSWRPQRLDLVA